MIVLEAIVGKSIYKIWITLMIRLLCFCFVLEEVKRIRMQFEVPQNTDQVFQKTKDLCEAVKTPLMNSNHQDSIQTYQVNFGTEISEGLGVV